MAIDIRFLLTLRAWLERARGHYQSAVTLGRAASDSAHTIDNAQWTAWTEAHLGAILAEVGDDDGALAHLSAGREAAERAGVRIQLSHRRPPGPGPLEPL